ncbi:hypothetical protein BJF78_14695 [Pseudonocardia sp. CNS-139]|nr:hypothetical protein BJF78_14695 [Pseudonocardia sp. CNS-139]
MHALAAALCHAAAVTLPLGAGRAAVIEALAFRLGPLTVLEIAHGPDRVEALVVPAGQAAPAGARPGTAGHSPTQTSIRTQT